MSADTLCSDPIDSIPSQLCAKQLFLDATVFANGNEASSDGIARRRRSIFEQQVVGKV